jgi:hypothetical protein
MSQGTPAVGQAAQGQKPKVWKATKPEIMQFWQQIQPNIPLAMQPIPYTHKGSTYQQDGIRVTGSREFIASTIARLKEFMAYENPRTKLMVVYRQTEKQGQAPDDRTTYVFYIQAKERGPKSGGAGDLPTLPTAGQPT